MSDSQTFSSKDILYSGQWVLLDSPHYEQPVEGILKEIKGNTITVDVSDLTPEEYTSAPLFDSKFTLYATNKNGHFEARVIFRGSSPLPDTLFSLECPEVMERTQQREFVRVPASLPVRYQILDSHGISQARETSLVNISSTGLCFAADRMIPCPSAIALQISGLPGIDSLTLKSDAVRCRAVESNGAPVYHVGVYFGDYIPAADRDNLMKALIALQGQQKG